MCLWFVPSVVLAGNLKFGAQCNQNSDCLSNDCENSSLEKEKDDFCDCVTAADCAAEYDTNPGEVWSCRDGTTASHDLDFCQSNQRGEFYPIPPTEPSAIDFITDPEASANLEQRITKPQPRIKIPGVNFSNIEIEKLKESDEDGTIWLNIPFIGEYIVAIFGYLIIIAGILSVIMIIVGGVQWSISGGNAAMIGAAQKRIAQALIGLLLSVGVYSFLYFVNPNLVQFKSLRVLYVKGKQLVEENDAIDERQYPRRAGRYIIQKPTWTAETFDCNNPPEPMGVVPKDSVISYSCPGILGTATTIEEMKKPLCKAGQLANGKGYSIKILNSYRSFDQQVQIWCDPKDKRPAQEKRKYKALPGFSNHGHGQAVDVALYREKESLTGGTDANKQCMVDDEIVKTLAEFFYEADPNLNRLETEIWHFEYGTGGQSFRSKYTEKPVKCN